jgi:hypothetical protein
MKGAIDEKRREATKHATVGLRRSQVGKGWWRWYSSDQLRQAVVGLSETGDECSGLGGSVLSYRLFIDATVFLPEKRTMFTSKPADGFFFGMVLQTTGNHREQKL